MIDAKIVIERLDEMLLTGQNRPERRNALEAAKVAQFHRALDEARVNPCVLVVHLTTPGILAVGDDLRELLERDAEDGLCRINIKLFNRLERRRWPGIAAIDGPAIDAGCELALACDLRVCSLRARFGQPESSFGIFAGAGGNWRLPLLVGVGVARQILYLGATLEAAAARDAGLVDEIADALLDAVKAMAATVGQRSWRAAELTKLSLSFHLPTTPAFDLVA